jgi:hypothetical protein
MDRPCFDGPTASQLVALGQAAPLRNTVPDTTFMLPGVPLPLGTTTPSIEAPTATNPTASHLAFEQATASSSAVPEATRARPGAPSTGPLRRAVGYTS